jgi:DNA processing protein
MTAIDEQAALIVLLRHATERWSVITDRVEDVGSAMEVLRSSNETHGQGALFQPDDDEVANAIAEISAWEAEGIKLVTVLDDAYPARLRLVHERPPFLFSRGAFETDRLAVAVVGTRKPSAAGLEHADRIASGLAERGVTVVSGLAAGIDTAAHRAALHAGGRTVAVIGTGIRRFYPPHNADLQRQIATQGQVLSQFWPDAPPTKQSFPMRNAVMSGFAQATVVIEAAYRSGARMQARLALGHGRRVFLMRSLLEHEWARDYARRPNTTVVDAPAEVFTGLDSLATTPEELVWS